MGEIIFVLLLGLGLIGLACMGLAANNGKPDDKGIVEFDDKTGRLLYKASFCEWVCGIVVFLLLFGIAAYWVLSGNFGASGPITMPWGTIH